MTIDFESSFESIKVVYTHCTLNLERIMDFKHVQNQVPKVCIKEDYDPCVKDTSDAAINS